MTELILCANIIRCICLRTDNNTLVNLLMINKSFYALNYDYDFWYQKIKSYVTDIRGINYRNIFYTKCIGYNLYVYKNNSSTKLSTDPHMKLCGFFGKNSSYIIRPDKSLSFYDGMHVIHKEIKSRSKIIDRSVMQNNNQLYKLRLNGHHVLLSGENETIKKFYVCATDKIVTIDTHNLCFISDGKKISRRIYNLDSIKCVCCNYNKSIALVSDNKFTQYNFFDKEPQECLSMKTQIRNPINVLPVGAKNTYAILDSEGNIWFIDISKNIIKLIYDSFTEIDKIIKMKSTNYKHKLLIKMKNLVWSYYNTETRLSEPFIVPDAFDVSINCLNGQILYLI